MISFEIVATILLSVIALILLDIRSAVRKSHDLLVDEKIDRIKRNR